MLDVLYVDYGNTKTVTLREVQYLEESFFIDELNVFKCRLFGIKFNDNEMLTKASTKFYQDIKEAMWNIKTLSQIKVLIKRVEQVEVSSFFDMIN